MGGVGKSQLAAAYAHEQAGRVDLLAWIDAPARDAVISGYAQVATALGHQPTSAADGAAQWFLAWLQNNTTKAWLVVLDDLADPADLRGLWPTGPGGGVVVTTRRTDAVLFGRDRQRISIGPYTPAQARSYLAAKLGSSAQLDEADDPRRRARFVAAGAGAGRRVHARPRWRRARAIAVGSVTAVVGSPSCFPDDALADDYRATAAATWSISIQAADRLPPAGLSRALLELLAVLDPNGVPVDVVRTAAAAAYVAGPGSASAGTPSTNLARFSLVALDKSDSVRVHALVQRAATEHLDQGRRHDLIRAAADALLQIWPPIERDAQLGATLRANALAVAARSDTALWVPAVHPVLKRAGHSLGERGLRRRRRRILAGAHPARATTVLGPEHHGHPGPPGGAGAVGGPRGASGRCAARGRAARRRLPAGPRPGSPGVAVRARHPRLPPRRRGVQRARHGVRVRAVARRRTPGPRARPSADVDRPPRRGPLARRSRRSRGGGVGVRAAAGRTHAGAGRRPQRQPRDQGRACAVAGSQRRRHRGGRRARTPPDRPAPALRSRTSRHDEHPQAPRPLAGAGRRCPRRLSPPSSACSTTRSGRSAPHHPEHAVHRAACFASFAVAGGDNGVWSPSRTCARLP